MWLSFLITYYFSLISEPFHYLLLCHRLKCVMVREQYQCCFLFKMLLSYQLLWFEWLKTQNPWLLCRIKKWVAMCLNAVENSKCQIKCSSNNSKNKTTGVLQSVGKEQTCAERFIPLKGKGEEGRAPHVANVSAIRRAIRCVSSKIRN